MEKAACDPALEPEFLQALLIAELFVHLPLSDDSGRVRLIQFTRPDGLLVIPVFTTAEKAAKAAQGVARIERCVGRELLEGTRGATLMLNPNDLATTLYPEEIVALLDLGVSTIAPAQGTPGPLRVAPAGDDTRLIGELLMRAVCDLPGVCAIGLLDGWLEGSNGSPTHLLIGICVPDAGAERVARAIGVSLGVALKRLGRIVDLTTYAVDGPQPEWLDLDGFTPLWVHSIQR